MAVSSLTSTALLSVLTAAEDCKVSGVDTSIGLTVCLDYQQTSQFTARIHVTPLCFALKLTLNVNFICNARQKYYLTRGDG